MPLSRLFDDIVPASPIYRLPMLSPAKAGRNCLLRQDASALCVYLL